MNEICEDGSPQSKFTLYLLKEWGYALNEEMAVMIGQKAQELFVGPGANQCNCLGTWHAIGSQGCTMEASQ
jgi:hypothetical protein